LPITRTKFVGLDQLVGASWLSSQLTDDFHAICDFGGRLAGTDSELAARAFLAARLDEIGGVRNDFTFDYTGWQPAGAELSLNGRMLEAIALPGSPSVTDADLEVVDLGAGTQRDFAAAGERVHGRVVLVRHEYPFTTGHTHRRDKYKLAIEAGAAAFLITNNNPMGGTVTGGSGEGADTDIPAAGLSWHSGEMIRAAAAIGAARVRLTVRSEQRTWPAQNLILDLPGRTDEWVVLCAHVDGHQLAESAMDNATGLAAVLETGRRLAPIMARQERGLRLALFTVEEWRLTGSARYVAQLSDTEKAKIRLAIALDSITGHPRLSALTGADAGADALVAEVGASLGAPIDVIRPQLSNSDHYSFQAAGIRALRLIAGYGREESLTRFLLTPADTRSMVDSTQLKAATLAVIALVHRALSAPL
jgi:aminopeptidase YwaD